MIITVTVTILMADTSSHRRTVSMSVAINVTNSVSVRRLTGLRSQCDSGEMAKVVLLPLSVIPSKIPNPPASLRASRQKTMAQVTYSSTLPVLLYFGLERQAVELEQSTLTRKLIYCQNVQG
jgi:hypothetical protein